MMCVACSGYAADEVTHCIRPEDVKSRRAVVILRRFVFELCTCCLLFHIVLTISVDVCVFNLLLNASV